MASAQGGGGAFDEIAGQAGIGFGAVALEGVEQAFDGDAEQLGAAKDGHVAEQMRAVETLRLDVEVEGL